MVGAERVLGRGLRQENGAWDQLSAAGRLSVGRHSYGRPDIYLHPGDSTRMSIGSFVSIAHGVEIFLGGNHRVDWVSTFPFRFVFELPGALEDGLPASKGDVTIGHDVWIGKDAKVLSGVRIGDGAVVGAYAVVTKDVRPYAIVVGSPAREVKRRFTDEQVEALEEIAWWEWPMEEIMEAIPLLCDADIDAFIELARRRP